MTSTDDAGQRPPRNDHTPARVACIGTAISFLLLFALFSPWLASASGQASYYPKGTKPGEGGWYDLRGIEIPVIYSDRMIKRKKLDIKRKYSNRLMELNAKDVIAGIGKKPVYYFESEHIKFVCQFPSVNLAVEMAPKNPRERRNWEFMKKEIEDLRRVFPKAKFGTLNGHQVAHLVMNRLVRFYKKFEKEMKFWEQMKGLRLKDYGMGPHLGQKAPYEIVVINNKRNYLKWEDRFIGRRSVFGQKWNLMQDGALTFTCYYVGPFPRFNNFLHHNFAQLLIWGYRHWSFELPGWLQMGFGHYIEREITPRYNTYDFDEGGVKNMPKSWRFKKRIYKLVATKKSRPFAEIKQWKKPSEFNGDDFQQIWSMTEFLIGHDKEKYRTFVDLVSQQKKQDEALKRAFGWSFNTFEERWKDYVKRTYAAR